jgi:DNA polymerase epsilon subunit 2
MWLYPLPDLVVVGDKLDHFTTEAINGCVLVNPGSFGKNDFSFKTYVPKSKLVEDSQVPADEDA